MKTFTLDIWDDESRLVTFYSVRWNGEAETETDKFLKKYRSDPRFGGHLQELLSLLFDSMGEEQGAHEVFFTRNERAAAGLPPAFAQISNIRFKFRKFPLRLYCLRLNSSLVILFGGGLKTARTAQESPDLAVQFEEANHFAKVINKAIRVRTIQISASNRTLKTPDGRPDIILS